MSELQDLFDKQPPLTDEEVSLIIKKMRENRAQFELGLKQPIGERKKAPKKSNEDLLKDLGL